MKQPIRVLHVLQRMEAGGSQALLMNLYRNIDRTKVQFDFLVEYPNKQFYDDEIVSLGGKIYYSNVRNDKNIFKFKKILKKVLKENNYKILHMHTYSIGYFVLKTAKECGVPVRIAHSHNNQAVKDKFYLLKLIMQKLYTKYATDLFACSKEAGEYLFKGKDFTVIKNAIDTKTFLKDENIRKEIRDELHVNNKFVIGNVGRLHDQKNQKFLLDVFYEIANKKKDAVLLIIGTGPLEKELKNKAKKLNLDDRVFFLGNRSDMNRIYQAMDVFVLPSLFEGLGIVAIEAQAASLPVVASSGVAKDAVITENIIRIELDSPIQQWVDAIINVQSTDKDVYEKIKKAGYDVYENSKIIEKYYLDKYKDINN